MNQADLNKDSHDATENYPVDASGSRPRGTQAQDQRRKGFDLGGWVAVAQNLGTQVEEQVQKRPYVVLGATVGLGFAAGSLLGSRLGQWLLAAGIGYAIRNGASGRSGVDRIRAGLEKLAGEVDPD